MFSFIVKMLVAVITTLVIVSNASSQQVQTPSQTVQDKYVTEKGFRSRVFELKHRDPNSLFGVLGPLGSGFKGATMSVSRDFRTITVRDFPENIATIEEALKRLDTPEAPRSNIELRVHVLTATNTEGSTNQYPPELNDVIKQLQSTLNYKHYNLLTSLIQRVKDGASGINSSGTIDAKLPAAAASLDPGTVYGLNIQSVSLNAAPSGASTVEIGSLNFEIRFPVVTGFSNPTSGNTNLGSFPTIQYQNGGVKTAVSVRDGEKVVVGTASLRDKGLILVLSAKVVK
ncbi:MAG: hypothetical protein H0T92_09150 [Pyrinomonadaceae bacterium]|nr:hypothetical protein [Pyrinomonadaceae bacterium]